jgi:hypothetical protein
VASSRCPHEDEAIRAAWSDGQAGPPSPRSRRHAEALRAEAGASPDAWVDTTLAAHLGECESCAEIAALARAFRDEREAACAASHPPAAGAVWWRAQRRAREDAARRAVRPISFVHGIALGCAAAAVFAIVGLGLGDVRANLVQWWNAFHWPSAPAGVVVGALSTLPLGVLLLMAAALLLAPVALYLALTEG